MSIAGCDCDPLGSMDEGICDSISDEKNVAGQCHCKQNVDGRRCDTCSEGFWNLNGENMLGCEPCTCNKLGTVQRLACDKYTGQCACKQSVYGRNCNECMPETFGLSATEDGCQPCECDPIGSYVNHCDGITGQCPCRENMEGRRCNIRRRYNSLL